MKSPPSITTSLSSPMVSGYLHCISSAKPYMGWSNAITAACPWSEVFNSFHRNSYAMLDHGYRVRSFCKKRQQPTLASCVFAFLSFSVVSRPWYYSCWVLVRGFSISSLLGNRGLRILFVSLSLPLCWWSSTFCLIWLSHSVSFIVVSDNASSSPFTLHCILGILKTTLFNFWHDQGGIYVGVAGWQWACSLWCRHISLLKACVFHTFPFHG